MARNMTGIAQAIRYRYRQLRREQGEQLNTADIWCVIACTIADRYELPRDAVADIYSAVRVGLETQHARAMADFREG